MHATLTRFQTALRIWTSTSDTTAEARYDQNGGNTVDLRRDARTQIRIDLVSLSEADDDFLLATRAL